LVDLELRIVGKNELLCHCHRQRLTIPMDAALCVSPDDNASVRRYTLRFPRYGEIPCYRSVRRERQNYSGIALKGAGYLQLASGRGYYHQFLAAVNKGTAAIRTPRLGRMNARRIFPSVGPTISWFDSFTS
jgi:hypothetical protein